MARTASDPRAWLIAAHTATSLTEKRSLHASAIAATTARNADATTISNARYAAAMTAITDSERAMVLAMPRINTGPSAERRWLEGTVLATRDDAIRRTTFEEAMRSALSVAPVDAKLQFLAAASTAAANDAERSQVANEALRLYEGGIVSWSHQYRYAALRLAIRALPPESRRAHIATAEAAFLHAPASASPSLRQLLVEHGDYGRSASTTVATKPTIRDDVIAGASMAFSRPNELRHDQLEVLAVMVSPSFDAFE